MPETPPDIRTELTISLDELFAHLLPDFAGESDALRRSLPGYFRACYLTGAGSMAVLLDRPDAVKLIDQMAEDNGCERRPPDAEPKPAVRSKWLGRKVYAIPGHPTFNDCTGDCVAVHPPGHMDRNTGLEHPVLEIEINAEPGRIPTTLFEPSQFWEPMPEKGTST